MTCLPGGGQVEASRMRKSKLPLKCTDFLPTPRLGRYATSRPIVSILSPVVGRRGGAAPARTPVASGQHALACRRKALVRVKTTRPATLGVEAHGSDRSAAYNPLLEVRRVESEVRDVQNIADVLVDPEGALERRNHWEKTSHSLLVGAILHAREIFMGSQTRRGERAPKKAEHRSSLFTGDADPVN